MTDATSLIYQNGISLTYLDSSLTYHHYLMNLFSLGSVTSVANSTVLAILRSKMQETLHYLMKFLSLLEI